jgi:hypothetical protein
MIIEHYKKIPSNTLEDKEKKLIPITMKEINFYKK